MQQFLLALLLVLGGLSYYLWNENGVLKENNAKLEIAIQTQEEAINNLQNDFALQTTQLNEMTVKSQAAQRELNRYNEFIRNYELSDKIMKFLGQDLCSTGEGFLETLQIALGGPLMEIYRIPLNS